MLHRIPARHLSVSLVCLALSILSVLPVHAIPGLTLSRRSGPPTTVLAVSGSGFQADEPVTVSFDTLALATATASSAGDVALVRIDVPKTALPGDHLVRMVGQRSNTVAQAAFIVRTNWPMFQFSARRSGFNPYENVLNRTNVDKLAVAWKVPVTGLYPSLITVEGRVYTSARDGKMKVLDPRTGALLWTARYGGILAAESGRIYVVSGDGKLHAYKAAGCGASTCTPLWTATSGYTCKTCGFNTLVVENGIVYVSMLEGFDNKGRRYAFDGATGKQLWLTTTSNDWWGNTAAVASGKLYAPHSDDTTGTIYVMDATTGTILWKTRCGTEATVPVVVNGTIFMSSNSGRYDIYRVCGFNASAPGRRWERELGPASLPAVANGIVYIRGTDSDDNTGYRNGAFYALDARTGATIWKVPVGGGTPVVANEIVYTLDAKNLTMLDAATGAVLAMKPIEGDMVSSPVVVDGTVYLPSGGYLYAFRVPNP